MNILIPVMVFILIAIGGIIIRRSTKLNKRLPLNVVNASVKEKRIDKWKGTVGSPWVKEYYIDFDVEGEVIPIKVVKFADYNNVEVSDKGILTYQKNLLYKIFISFEKNPSKKPRGERYDPSYFVGD